MDWSKWNPPATVEIQDEPHELRVVVTKDLRGQQRVVSWLVVLVLMAVFVGNWQSNSVGKKLLFAFVLFAFIYSLIFRDGIEAAALAVTPVELSYRFSSASGKRSGRFIASEVKEVDYGYGSKSQPAGLHIRHGLVSHTCVLPNVTEDEAYRLRGLIMDRFPEFNNGLAAPSDLITLNLSERR